MKTKFEVGDFVLHKYGFYGRILSISGNYMLLSTDDNLSKQFEASKQFCRLLDWTDGQKMIWMLENE